MDEEFGESAGCLKDYCSLEGDNRRSLGLAIAAAIDYVVGLEGCE